MILAFSGAPDYVMLSHVRECERLGVTVSLVPRLFESINQRTTLGHVGGVPLVTLHEISPRGWQFAVKHVLDSVIAAGVLVVLAPVMGCVAVLVRLSSPGPILFRQRRIGRDGRQFDLLKFRTMRVTDEQGRHFAPARRRRSRRDRGRESLHAHRALAAGARARRAPAVRQRPAR